MNNAYANLTYLSRVPPHWEEMNSSQHLQRCCTLTDLITLSWWEGDKINVQLKYQQISQQNYYHHSFARHHHHNTSVNLDQTFLSFIISCQKKKSKRMIKLYSFIQTILYYYYYYHYYYYWPPRWSRCRHV